MRYLTRSQAGHMLGLGKRGVTNLSRSGFLLSSRCLHGHRAYKQTDVLAAVIRRRHGGRATIWAAGHTIVGLVETYRVEHVAHRPGGDLDVIVSATPHDHRQPAYLAFRWDEGEWRALAGRDRDLESAVARAEHEHRYAGWDSAELAALLDTLEVGA